MNNKFDYDNLQYVAVNSGKIYNFSELTDPLTFLNEIKKGKMSLEEAKNYQQNYLDYLNIIRKGNKNANQKNTLANINIHFNARNSAIKFIEDYRSMIFEAKKLAKEQEGIGLKILTPNQMLKILPFLNDESRGAYNAPSQIKFKTAMLKSSLCDYIDAYILVKRTITINGRGADAAARQADERDKGVAFKNCALFINCISEINNTQIDNGKDIDIVMPMYNLRKYSDNYAKHQEVYGNILEMNQMMI